MLRKFFTVDKLQKPQPDIELREICCVVGTYTSTTNVEDSSWIPQRNEAYSQILIKCERQKQMQCVEIIVVVLQVDTPGQSNMIKH